MSPTPTWRSTAAWPAHTLSAPDGRSVSLGRTKLSRTSTFSSQTQFPGRFKAVAIEPMTGPANAFNSGDGLRWLAPGEAFTMSWGISASLEPSSGRAWDCLDPVSYLGRELRIP